MSNAEVSYSKRDYIKSILALRDLWLTTPLIGYVHKNLLEQLSDTERTRPLLYAKEWAPPD